MKAPWLKASRALLLLGAAALCALVLPSPARAAGTVRVEIYIGGAAACGAGIFLWFSGSWEAGLDARDPAGALLRLEKGRLSVAPPIPGLRPPGEAATGSPRERWELELFSWRF